MYLLGATIGMTSSVASDTDRSCHTHNANVYNSPSLFFDEKACRYDVSIRRQTISLERCYLWDVTTNFYASGTQRCHRRFDIMQCRTSAITNACPMYQVPSRGGHSPSYAAIRHCHGKTTAAVTWCTHYNNRSSSNNSLAPNNGPSGRFCWEESRPKARCPPST